LVTVVAPHMVLILGAGFSRSVSDHLPLVDELGNEAAGVVGLGPADGVPTPFLGGEFEVWLSRQAQPQPYRSAAEDADAHARYLRLADGIARVIDQRVAAALERPAPDWLVALVRVLHARRATVLTFNYDPLVECAVKAARLHDWTTLIRYGVDDPPGQPVGYRNVLVDGEPRPHFGGYGGGVGAAGLSTFRLLKLHGSTTWYGVPGDLTGAALRSFRLPGRFGAPNAIDDAERRREMPGHYPFIVPPTASKNGFYGDPLLRQIWEQAARALRSDAQVHLVGYSLSLTDLVTRGLLQDNLPAGSVVDVADRDPRAALPADPPRVVERLGDLGYVEGNVHGGSRCIPDLVEALVAQQASQVLAQLVDRTVPGSDYTGKPMVVGSEPDRLAVVTRIRPGIGDDVVLETQGDWTGYPLARAAPTPTLPMLEELSARVVSGRGKLLAQVPGGAVVPIIDVDGFSSPLGAGSWTVLMPSTDS